MADDRWTVDATQRRYPGGIVARPDFNGTTGTDLNLFLNAVQTSWSPSNANEGGTIKLGHGDYFAASVPRLLKCMNLLGEGSNKDGAYGTRIWVPANQSGLIGESYFSMGSTGERSEGGHIDGIFFSSMHNSSLKSGGAAIGTLLPMFVAGATYAAGAIVKPTHYPRQNLNYGGNNCHVDPGYSWEVITGGVAGSEPAWHNYESSGNSIVTGVAATNPCQITCNDARVGSGHGLDNGEQIVISGVTGTASAANGTWTITYVSETVFTIALNATGLTYGGGGTTRRPDITSGGVTFRLLNAHGMEIRDSGFRISNCFISGFPGHGFHGKTYIAGEPQASINFLDVRNTSIYQCSSGVYMYGGDSNACSFKRIDAHFMRAYGFNDHSGAPNSYESCSTDVCENGAFVGTTLHISGATYGEAAPGANILYGASRWDGGFIGRPGLPPGAAVNFTMEGASMNFSDPAQDKRPLEWAEAASLGTLTAGMVVRPSVDDGYVRYVHVAGTLGAEPTWALGYNWGEVTDTKITTSGGVQFKSACVSTVSTFVRDTSNDFTSGRRVINLFNSNLTYLDAGFHGNAYPLGIFGWGALNTTFDSGQKWTLSKGGGDYWAFERAGLGTGEALRLYWGDKPVVGTPHGHEIINCVTPPSAPASGRRFYFEGDIHKSVDASSKIRGVSRVTAEVNNTTYTVLFTDTRVNVRSLSASRTITLPTLASVWDDYDVTIGDADGSCTVTNTIVVDGNGAETISGAATKTIGSAWGQVVLRAYPTRSTWVVVSTVGTVT